MTLTRFDYKLLRFIRNQYGKPYEEGDENTFDQENSPLPTVQQIAEKIKSDVARYRYMGRFTD